MDGSKESVRDGALFCYESLLMSAVQVDVNPDKTMSYQADLSIRGMVRGLITEDYKFVRYFSPLEFNTPTTIEELYEKNDVRLFDLNQDPEELHNLYRTREDGSRSFQATMEGVRRLRRHGVPFSALTMVNRANMKYPLEVYRFLRGLTDYIQFLPVVEALPAAYETDMGQRTATPPGIHPLGMPHPVAPFSVTPEGYGEFLCAVWEEWLRQDVGKLHVKLFDVTLGHLQGLPSILCVHDPLCGCASAAAQRAGSAGEKITCARAISAFLPGFWPTGKKVLEQNGPPYEKGWRTAFMQSAILRLSKKAHVPFSTRGCMTDGARFLAKKSPHPS